MSALALVLPQVYATAAVARPVTERKGPHLLRLVQASAEPEAAPQVREEAVPAGYEFYRKYTEAMLRRYLTMSMEAGRVPSLLGRELFRGNVTHYNVHSYNGSFAVTTTGPNTLTYAETGANSTTSGGTLTLLTGGYALYPMAEVLSVFNASSKAVDGQLTLAANTVPWAANDPVEEPHYFQEQVRADGPKAARYEAFNTDGTEAGEALPMGWHVVTLICGASGSPAHYLYDGQEVGSYLHQGQATCPAPSTGTFQIGGSSKYTGTWFVGKIAAAWAWSTALSVSDGSLAAQSALAYMRAKGVPMGYRSVTQATPVILTGMDSRTAGVGLTPTTVWPALMTLTDTTYTRVNLGIPGATAFDVCNQFPVLYGQQVGAGSGPSILVIWGGVNDILFSNQTTRQIANNLRCIAQGAKAMGSRVVLATEISATGQGDAGKDALDPILRAEAFGWGVDNIADLATDPILGADGASANGTYFPDAIHPNPAAEAHVTAIMQNAVNELLGSSETSRHQTAAANYTEVAGDRFLDLTGTTAQTVTLPSCLGYSLGRQVLNLGANVANVSAASGQTLLGATTIAPGTRAAFVPVPGAVATGGCTWERTQ